ncbi:hypothetical protein QJS04_geneDACA004488 [Acorus gramineus]|uniref:Uncharacterized protein n=1 Tax=Acorus gramineus TaxID=55184 RepID=A0AAV9B4X7_ACOGR|nr:hypothetical protein QJS04_geneDACA004488 [Acorus gramineus]
MAHPTNPRAPQPLPHHHHHHPHPIFICPLFLHHHHHHLHHNQLGCPNLCPHHAFHCLTHNHHLHHPLLTPPPPSLSDQHPISQNPTSAYVNSGVSNQTETDVFGGELKESGEQQQQQEPVEEEEDLFVMTDEWMEFFAKSEARRKLEKKKGKR